MRSDDCPGVEGEARLPGDWFSEHGLDFFDSARWLFLEDRLEQLSDDAAWRRRLRSWFPNSEPPRALRVKLTDFPGAQLYLVGQDGRVRAEAGHVRELSRLFGAHGPRVDVDLEADHVSLAAIGLRGLAAVIRGLLSGAVRVRWPGGITWLWRWYRIVLGA